MFHEASKMIWEGARMVGALVKDVLIWEVPLFSAQSHFSHIKPRVGNPVLHTQNVCGKIDYVKQIGRDKEGVLFYLNGLALSIMKINYGVLTPFLLYIYAIDLLLSLC